MCGFSGVFEGGYSSVCVCVGVINVFVYVLGMRAIVCVRMVGYNCVYISTYLCVHTHTKINVYVRFVCTYV